MSELGALMALVLSGDMAGALSLISSWDDHIMRSVFTALVVSLFNPEARIGMKAGAEATGTNIEDGIEAMRRLAQGDA